MHVIKTKQELSNERNVIYKEVFCENMRKQTAKSRKLSKSSNENFQKVQKKTSFSSMAPLRLIHCHQWFFIHESWICFHDHGNIPGMANS